MDWIERERIAAWVIVVSPNTELPRLAELLKSKGLEKTLAAFDPVNPNEVGKRTVIATDLISPTGRISPVNPGDTYGKGKPLGWFQALVAKDPGKHAIPVADLTEPAVITAWWAANRGLVPGALKELATVSKRKGPIGEQATAVITAATTAFEAAFATAGDGFAAYEKLERLQRRFDGLDLKELRNQLATLGKDAAIKKELRARGAYLECQRLLSSNKPKEQQAGRDGLAQLAKAMPDTVYGAKAATATP